VDDVLRSVPEMGEQLECSGAHEPNEVTAKNVPVAAFVRIGKVMKDKGRTDHHGRW
jgi:hypothetical protein